MAPTPFFFVGNRAVTPDQIAQQRKVAAALAATNGAPQNMWQGIEDAAGSIGGSLLDWRAGQQEAEQQQKYADALAALGDHPSRGDLVALAGNPWGNSGQDAVVQALLASDLKNSDPYTILNREKTQAEIDALKAKDVAKAPDVVELFDEKTGLPYKAAWNATTGKYEKLGGVKALSQDGLSVTTNPDGTVSIQQGAMPKLTEGQSKDAVYVTRASGALPTVDALGDKLTSLTEDVAGKVPYGGFLQSEDYQKADQAGREFLAAILRKDTGAAITQQEMEQYGSIYLPQPGDKPGKLEQKQAARRRAVKAIALGLPPQAIKALETEGVDIPDLPGTTTSPDKTAAPQGDAGWEAVPNMSNVKIRVKP